MKKTVIFFIFILIVLMMLCCKPGGIPITVSQEDTVVGSGGSYTFESTGEYLPFTIENIGSEDVVITDIALSGEGSDSFAITDDNTDGTIEPEGTYQFSAGFFPLEEGDFSATLTISAEGYSDGFSFGVSGSFTDTPPTENDWAQLNPSTKPTGRGNFTMTSAGGGRIIIYAGKGEDDGYYDDIWEYSLFTNQWTEIVPQGTENPGERNNPRITYIGDNKILLFGGKNIVWTKDELNDTWIFDLTTKEWTDVTPPTGDNPSVRHSHEIVYVGSDKAIMFGGTHSSDYYNDVWEFDTANYEWTELMVNDPSPTGQPEVRSSHSMVYVDDNKILMFGGSNWVSDIVYFDDTWIYDVSGNSWTEITGATNPLDRSSAGMTYDDVNDKVVLFGGFSDTASDEMNDTWEFDVATETWTEITTSTTPSKRTSCSLAYTGNGRVIMFGGREGFSPTTYFDETWEYGVTTSD
jgi:N-acetylneuraminic acid mutarotase